MDDKRERARKEIKQGLPAFAIGAGLGLLGGLYDMYKLISTGATFSQLLGPLCSLVAGILVTLAVLALRREKKAALPLFLSGLALGLVRWIIIDRTFQPSFIAFALLAVFAWFTWRLLSWVQVKALS
ncbi:MAG TPA: hypothetical protein VFR47_31005 [Anaerolineales bacterium]|nr:hypothetical protein [Anaerolineales bacterium]